MGKRHDRDKLVLSAGVFFAGNRQAAWEHGVEACFTSAARETLEGRHKARTSGTTRYPEG